MKKVLALMLAVMMLASVGCAWAEETGESIIWQGIPWGSNVEEVKGYLFQSSPDLIFKEQAELLYPVRVLCDTEMVRIEYTERAWKARGDTGITGTTISTTMAKVAGYTNVGTTLYFIYPVVNDEIIADAGSEAFYAARYSFEDGTDIYNDLEAKMTDVYGEAFAVNDMCAVFGEPVFTLFKGNAAKQYSDELKYHHSVAWKDDHGTIVLLSGSGSYLDKKTIKNISIIYFTVDGDEAVSEAFDIITNPDAPVVDSTDTNGL